MFQATVQLSNRGKTEDMSLRACMEPQQSMSPMAIAIFIILCHASFILEKTIFV